MSSGTLETAMSHINQAPAGARPAAAVRPVPASESVRTRLNLMLDETTVNERALSFGRLVFCAVGAAYMLAQPLPTARLAEGRLVLLACFGLGAVHSLVLLLLIRRGWYRTRLGYLSVTADITLITGGLASMLVADLPELALDNPIGTPLYLLAIALAGLRYNHRLTVMATLLAAVQYLIIVVVAMPLSAGPGQDGAYDASLQLLRLLLFACAGLIATFSVRRARELRTAAILDALTGVYNRGFLEERLHLEVDRAARYDRELAFAMLDVDHFKAYNDSFGHPAGDLALQQVARLLSSGLRSTDTVARYGGEEFVILLPETGKEQAMSLLDRLRESVEQHDFAAPGTGRPGRLTLSAGVACFPTDADSPDALRQHADDAVYRAKDAGRNRVVG